MILVTGGAGFIGSNLVAGLEAAGTGPIVVCDRLGDGDKWRNLAKRALEDIVPPQELFAWLDGRQRRLDAVFHLGAISATTARDGDAVIANNFRLGRRLWAWCAANRVRLIYASSAAVYGDGTQGFDDANDAAALARLRPLNLYGWSKLLFDRWVVGQGTGAERPVQVVGLRFFNVYGPNEYHKGAQRSMVPRLYEQISADGRCRLFRSGRPDIADGEQRRDFVYVDDCVDVMLWLHDNPTVNGIFNLGTGRGRTFRALTDVAFRTMGYDPQIDYIDMPAEVAMQYQYFTEARMDRLRGAGYHKDFTSLEQGVTRYIDAFLAAEDPYR